MLKTGLVCAAAAITIVVGSTFMLDRHRAYKKDIRNLDIDICMLQTETKLAEEGYMFDARGFNEACLASKGIN